MKTKFYSVVLLALFFSVGSANAHLWSLDPSDSAEVTAVGQEFTFDLNFTASEQIFVDGWDLEFTFDTNEIQAVYDTSGPEPLHHWEIDFNNEVASKLYANANNETGWFRAAAGNLTDYYQIEADQTVTFATLIFEVVAVEAFDGEPDLSIIEQTGNFGLSHYPGNSPILNMNAADGADVGSPVPIPAAAWLLGTGLLGLVGIRRNRQS